MTERDVTEGDVSEGVEGVMFFLFNVSFVVLIITFRLCFTL